jgi:hypothetical protein
MSLPAYLSHPVTTQILHGKHCSRHTWFMFLDFPFQLKKYWQYYSFVNSNVPCAWHTADLILFIRCIFIVFNYTYRQTRVQYVKYYKLFVYYIYICIYIYIYIKALLHVSADVCHLQRDDDTKEFIHIKLKRRNLQAVHQILLVTTVITT